MKNLRSTIILGVLTLGSLFTACDNFENDVPPAGMSQVVVHNDTITTKKNQSIQLDVLANDSIGGQATLQFSQPTHGSIQTGTNGTVIYQPDLDFIGTDNFNYKACIGNDCATALVTILVKNDSISTCNVKANDDVWFVLKNNTSTKSVLINDNLCGIDSLATMVKITKGPTHGTAFVTPLNHISFTPANNYVGPDEITYTISNSKGQSTAKLQINVFQQACIIQAKADSTTLIRHLGTAMDTVSIKVLTNDIICPNNGPVNVSILSQGHLGNAQVMLFGSRIIYSTGYPSKNATDNFQYRICQGNNCSTATVRINIR